jgi:hypothetical protein
MANVTRRLFDRIRAGWWPGCLLATAAWSITANPVEAQTTRRWFGGPTTPVAAPAPANGFATSIERLLEQSRQYAAAGELDRARHAAQRASKLAVAAESSLTDHPQASPAAVDAWLRQLDPRQGLTRTTVANPPTAPIASSPPAAPPPAQAPNTDVAVSPSRPRVADPVFAPIAPPTVTSPSRAAWLNQIAANPAPPTTAPTMSETIARATQLPAESITSVPVDQTATDSRPASFKTLAATQALPSPAEQVTTPRPPSSAPPSQNGPMFTLGTFAILGGETEPQTVPRPVIAGVDESQEPSSVTLSLSPEVASPVPVAASGPIESFSLGGFFSFESASDAVARGEPSVVDDASDPAVPAENIVTAPVISATSARPPIVLRSRSFPRPIAVRDSQPSLSTQVTPEVAKSSSVVETALLETRTDAPALRVNRGMTVAERLPVSSVPVARPNQPSPAVPSTVVAELDPSLLVGQESTALHQEAMATPAPTVEAASGMIATEWTATGSRRSTPRRDIHSVIDAAWAPTGSTRAEVTPAVAPETSREVAAEIIPLAASLEGSPAPVTLPLIATEFATEPATAPPPPAESASSTESQVAPEIVGPSVWLRQGQTEHTAPIAANEEPAMTSSLPDIVQVCARWWGIPARQVALILAGTGLMLLATGLMLFRVAGRREGT